MTKVWWKPESRRSTSFLRLLRGGRELLPLLKPILVLGERGFLLDITQALFFFYYFYWLCTVISMDIVLMVYSETSGEIQIFSDKPKLVAIYKWHVNYFQNHMIFLFNLWLYKDDNHQQQQNLHNKYFGNVQSLAFTQLCKIYYIINTYKTLDLLSLSDSFSESDSSSFCNRPWRAASNLPRAASTSPPVRFR